MISKSEIDWQLYSFLIIFFFQKSNEKKILEDSVYLTQIQLQRAEDIPNDPRNDGKFVRFFLDALCTRSQLAKSSNGGKSSNFNGKASKAIDREKMLLVKGELICFCWFIENYSSIFDFLLKNIFSGVFNTTIKQWHRWKLPWISTAIIYVGKTTLYFRIKVLKPLKKNSRRSNKAKYCYYNTIRTRIYFHVFESIMFS